MRKKTLLLFTLIFVTTSASAATSYVSDNLHTFIHSGAGTKYKIVGSVNSGEKIKIMQTNKNTGFTLVKDSKGRSGWINSKYVSKTPGLKERLPKLENELTKLNTQLTKARENIGSHSKQVSELQNANSALNEELQQVQALNRNLNAKLDTQKNDLLMRWFSYGGIVGGVGLLLGLILPLLMPSRRSSSKSRW